MGVALLLMETEVRALAPIEAQELSIAAGESLKTLTVSPQTTEIQLSERPLLVLFRGERSVQEAYGRLRALLESTKPVPKPRAKPPLSQQTSLVEALRRGAETGATVLLLRHDPEIKTIPRIVVNTSSNEPAGSSDQGTRREDVRLSTYKRLDSLEETIRELENTLMEISGHPSAELLYSQTAANDTAATPEPRKPPVPPKPWSLSPVSTQVDLSHPAVQTPALTQHALSSVLPASLWVTVGSSLFQPLMSAPCLNRHLIATEIENVQQGTDNRVFFSPFAVCLFGD